MFVALVHSAFVALVHTLNVHICGPCSHLVYRIPVFKGAFTLVPGYDISVALRSFQWPYTDILLDSVKDHFVRRNEKVLRSLNSSAVDVLLSVSGLQDFVDNAYMFAGYSSAAEYYAATNPINRIHDIDTPQLIINSMDDPCSLPSNMHVNSTVPAHNGLSYAQVAGMHNSTIVVTTRSGSHVPFFDGRVMPFVKDALYPYFMIDSWADAVMIEYFDALKEIAFN